MNKEMVEQLRNEYAIYMTADGRISICGLNTKNLDYIAEAFHAVTKDKHFWVTELALTYKQISLTLYLRHAPNGDDAFALLTS
mgnify:CR=1 FL=1